MNKEIRNRISCSIDKMREDLFAIGKSIWENPETGFKEVRTNRLVADQFRNLGLEFVSCGDIPGLKATFDTGRPGPGLAILGELDEPGVNTALQQELGVLVVAVFIHAATGVAGLLVTAVERVMLIVVAQR